MLKCDVCGALEREGASVVNEYSLSKRRGAFALCACETCISDEIARIYGNKRDDAVDFFYSDFYLQQKIFKNLRLKIRC